MWTSCTTDCVRTLPGFCDALIRLEPKRGYVILLDRFVFSHDCRTVLVCLRDQQPIEGVFVIVRQESRIDHFRGCRVDQPDIGVVQDLVAPVAGVTDFNFFLLFTTLFRV